MLNRAYSVLQVKAVDDEKRTIEGIATTATPDRMGDIIETNGVEFKLPLPLLYQHNSRQPIGTVISAKVGKDGITIKAQIAAPGIAGFIDEAWALIKSGLVRGLSIGFRSLEHAFMDDKSGGIRFVRTEWMELSAVTLPANAEATILTVKSADAVAIAALGNSRSGAAVRLNRNLPGASGTTQARGSMKTIQEQIASFEAKRAADEAARTAIMTKASEEGRTLDQTETETYDGLTAEIKQVDAHLVRLKSHEADLVARATRITAENTASTVNAHATRGSVPVSVRSNAPKGIGMARVAIALINAEGNRRHAAEFAKEVWPDSPDVYALLSAPIRKAAVEAGDTTTSGWASQLIPAAQQLQGEFLELLRPATILGRIPGLRRVPFNVAIPVQTGGGTYGWVGEARGKPVTSLTFDSVTLRWAKAAGIIVITQELAKFSSPSAEMIVRDDMIAGCARFLDTQFVSTTAAVANVSPAGIIASGVTAVTASGTTAAAFRVDMNNMLNNFIANNVDPSGIVILMSATQALALSLMITDLGIRLFPDIGVNGGTILGFPAVISENVGTRIIALNARDILLAEDGGISIDVSTQASVEMNTVPIAGDTSPITGAVLKSLWQNNLVGLRVEKYITWLRGRAAAVEYINGNAYVPS
jgi:HK97 family phage major capsid protein/HK97 family phage prohead protease